MEQPGSSRGSFLEVAGSESCLRHNPPFAIRRRGGTGFSHSEVPHKPRRHFSDITPIPKEAIISTPRLNSYGARVLTEGIDLTQYQKNPVLLYMHRRGRKGGYADRNHGECARGGDTLYGTPKFDDDTEDERNISKKWERGTLRMLSAGLDIMEWSEDPTPWPGRRARP